MKPKLETISKALDVCYRNANSLLEEADLLYNARKYARAYFLAQIAIEEMGKISILTASVQYPVGYSAFWKFFWKLLRSHVFKIGKAEISFQNSMFNFQLDGGNEIFKTATVDNRIKMESLYIDIKKDIIIDPFKIINSDMARKKIDEAKKKFTVFRDRKQKGSHGVDALRLIDNFYSKPEVRSLQNAVFIEKRISPEDYLKELFKVAHKYSNEPLAKLFIELASAITKK